MTSKKDTWFKGRHWRVCTEVNGERESGEAKLHYVHGHFVIEPPHTFQTPLGHRGRAGVLVQETDADGNDLADSPRQTFGLQSLVTANAVYGAGTVTGLT